MAEIVEAVSRAVVRIEAGTAQGSGTLIDADGHILTNHHVVENRRTVTVWVPSMRSYEGSMVAARAFNGTVVGFSEQDDLAVVKIGRTDGKPFHFLEVSDVRPDVGEEVLVVGYPYGDVLTSSSTVSRGIVSAYQQIAGNTWIQTDAPINPGSSGGAGVTLKGQLFGVPTAILRESEGVGFLIPLFDVRHRITDMMGGASFHPSPTPTRTPTPTQTPLPSLDGIVNIELSRCASKGRLFVARGSVAITSGRFVALVPLRVAIYYYNGQELVHSEWATLEREAYYASPGDVVGFSGLHVGPSGLTADTCHAVVSHSAYVGSVRTEARADALEPVTTFSAATQSVSRTSIFSVGEPWCYVASWKDYDLKVILYHGDGTAKDEWRRWSLDSRGTVSCLRESGTFYFDVLGSWTWVVEVFDFSNDSES